MMIVKILNESMYCGSFKCRSFLIQIIWFYLQKPISAAYRAKVLDLYIMFETEELKLKHVWFQQSMTY